MDFEVVRQCITELQGITVKMDNAALLQRIIKLQGILIYCRSCFGFSNTFPFIDHETIITFYKTIYSCRSLFIQKKIILNPDKNKKPKNKNTKIQWSTRKKINPYGEHFYPLEKYRFPSQSLLRINTRPICRHGTEFVHKYSMVCKCKHNL